MKTLNSILLAALLSIFVSCVSPKTYKEDDKFSISGIYPHLAFYNNEAECGTGAVVPWAGSLWAITYAPHSAYGSSDKLYQITGDLDQIVRKESIGGTPANRLIHQESNQLFIGPYSIDAQGNVKVMSYHTAPGRYTGAARHLTDPESKIYIATMEEGFYEVDVNTLETKSLWSDDNVSRKPDSFPVLENNLLGLPGWHGKGLYSGQGVLIYSNNGEHSNEALEKFDIESGSLCEWDGREWKVVRRNQFTEITGPGGIYGNQKPDSDPIWSTGFDYKSVLLGARHSGEWFFYRLPKASYSYDGAHGWNTEWPRIRNVGRDNKPDYLMTMHGMFWRFPEDFTPQSSSGIRPRSAYLKVVGDYTRWGDRLVFGCDDSAEKEFLNRRKAKGDVGGPGQSNSNLWFMGNDGPDSFGPDNASGYVWLNENIGAGKPSDPFLFAGWEKRCAWIKNPSNQELLFTFERDLKGDNKWTQLQKITVPAGGSTYIAFESAEQGEWIRVSIDRPANVSVGFVYASVETRKNAPNDIFSGLATVDRAVDKGGLLWGLGSDRRKLGILASDATGESGYYEMDEKMNIVPVDDKVTASKIRDRYAVNYEGVVAEEGSVLIVDDNGRRWRLPLGEERYTKLNNEQTLRVCREVSTERDLLNCHGTFYELPAENADGYAKIRPIASHNFMINDYASYRGMIIMTGINSSSQVNNPHIFKSSDGRVAVWAGAIDDLWKIGKPVGSGGPWIDATVKTGQISDPYLIGFYDKRSLTLSHESKADVSFKVEVDPTGDGQWMTYNTFVVKPQEKLHHEFPSQIMARWIRFSVDKTTKATTWLEYK